MLASAVQFSKAPLPISSTLLGSSMEARLLQPSKASLSISCSAVGSAIACRLPQPLKAPLLIFFRSPRMFTLVSFLQSLKAFIPISLTLEGISICCSASQSLKALSPMLVNPDGSTMAPKLEQSLKAPSSILLTSEGIVTSFSLLQPLNMFLLMLLSPDGSFTVSSSFAPEKQPEGSSWAFSFSTSLPSSRVAPDRSRCVVRYSPFFSLALVRLTISCISFTSLPFMGPLMVSDTMANFSASLIWSANWPACVSLTFLVTCAKAIMGSMANAKIIILFIVIVFINGF